MKSALKLIAAAATACFTSMASAADATGESALAAKYGCAACHAPAKKVVGPSYRDVAKKYAGEASAPVNLAAKIKSGGSGTWGSIPMPPNNVPDSDLKQLVAWILSQGT